MEYDPNFHGDFWVAVATVAPVIGLGYLLLLTAVGRRMAANIAAMETAVTLLPAPDGANGASGWKRRGLLMWLGFRTLLKIYRETVSFVFVFLGAIATIWDFLKALLSLSNYRDMRPPSSVVYEMGLALAVPMVVALLDGVIAYYRTAVAARNAERGKHARKPDAD